MAITALKNSALILNGKSYTKEDLLGNNNSALFMQSITITDDKNLIHYPLAINDPNFEYKVFYALVGDLDFINNPNIDARVQDGELIVNSYDSSLSKVFLVIGWRN